MVGPSLFIISRKVSSHATNTDADYALHPDQDAVRQRDALVRMHKLIPAGPKGAGSRPLPGRSISTRSIRSLS